MAKDGGHDDSEPFYITRAPATDWHRQPFLMPWVAASQRREDLPIRFMPESPRCRIRSVDPDVGSLYSFLKGGLRCSQRGSDTDRIHSLALAATKRGYLTGAAPSFAVSMGHRSAVVLFAVMVAFGSVVKAAPASDRREAGDTVISLPEFAVREGRVGAYGASEATATTRVRVPIQDVPQTVSVVPRELIDDTQGLQMLDVAKFVTPITQGSTGGGDRYTIRGFETALRFVDGVSLTGQVAFNVASNLSNVERLEIIKGPNTILVPGGGFGGIMNQITKSPKSENFTHFTVRARSFLGSEASVDANRVFNSGSSAIRLVGTTWDADGYFQGQYRRGWLFAPSFAHRFANRTELIVKLEILHNTESASAGVVIDPAVGTSIGGYARKLPLLPRNNQWGPSGDSRFRSEARLSSELRFRMGERIASRLWWMADTIEFHSRGAPGGSPVAGNQGGTNPLTGEYEPFKTFAYNAATRSITVTPLPPSALTQFNRSSQSLLMRFDEVHVKNDYAADHALWSGVRGMVVAGWSANASRLAFQNWGTSRPPVDYASGSRVGSDEPFLGTLRFDKRSEQRDLQVFAQERILGFGERLILSGGVARFWGVLTRIDQGNLPPPTPLRSTRNAVTDLSLGVIYKPVPDVSLFIGYNRVGGALPVSTLAGEFTSGSFMVGMGEQREYGIKTTLWKQRVSASLSHYEITQSNVSVPNGGFIRDPMQPRYVYYDLANRGWEFEVNALLAPGLNLVGNFQQLRMRDRNRIPQRMVPDSSGALFVKYSFRAGTLRGLGFSIGVDYVARVPGDSSPNSLLTAAGVPIQPTFYLAPRTLVQGGVHYRGDRGSIGVSVHNLSNRDYIHVANGRNGLVPGEPRNYSITVEMKF